MIIAGIPKSNSDSASCRIRFYAFLNAMPEDVSWHHYKKDKPFDVLYIQKATDFSVKVAAKKAFKNGIPVIYDMDDIRKDWDSKGYDSIIKYSSAVTTDTEERALVIRQHTYKPVFVISDCVDYGVNSRVEYREFDAPKIVTFGHKSTAQYAIPYFVGIPNITHICNEKIGGLGNFYAWDKTSFIKTLKKHDVAFLAHKNDWQSDCKSINRLLVCMSIGMPTVVSDTLAYRGAMESTGYPELCVRNPEKLRQKLDLLKSASYRRQIGDSFIAYSEDYKPEISAIALLKLMQGFL